MRRTRETSEARQRILGTADRLFYRDGIRAVGIDRSIAEANVAKTSLYKHFSSKDDLILACGFEVAMVRDAIGGTSNEEGDGVQAALVNFRFLAHALWTTEEALAKFADLGRAVRFNGVETQRAEALANSGSAS